MSPRAIALQGIGFGLALVAVQGLSALEAILPTARLGSYSTGDEGLHERIGRQNNLILQMTAAFISTGALHP